MDSRVHMTLSGRIAVLAAAAVGLSLVVACKGTFQPVTALSGGGGGGARDSTLLVQLSLSPAAATVAPGGTVQYTAQGKLIDGTTISPSLTFVVTGGGTITTGGLFTAGATAGTELVIATQTGGPIGTPPCCTDTSVVTVTTASMVRALRGGTAP